MVCLLAKLITKLLWVLWFILYTWMFRRIKAWIGSIKKALISLIRSFLCVLVYRVYNVGLGNFGKKDKKSQWNLLHGCFNCSICIHKKEEIPLLHWDLVPHVFYGIDSTKEKNGVTLASQEMWQNTFKMLTSASEPYISKQWCKRSRSGPEWNNND